MQRFRARLHVRSGRDPHIFDDETIAADEEARLLEVDVKHGLTQEDTAGAFRRFRSLMGNPVSEEQSLRAAKRHAGRQARRARKTRRHAFRAAVRARVRITESSRIPSVLTTSRTATHHCGAVGRSRSGGRRSSTTGSDPGEPHWTPAAGPTHQVGAR